MLINLIEHWTWNNIVSNQHMFLFQILINIVWNHSSNKFYQWEYGLFAFTAQELVISSNVQSASRG